MHENEEKEDPAAMARELRAKALAVTAAELGLAPTDSRPGVGGVLMELGYAQAVATLAVFAEGSTSLYISTGGGVIGAGEHKPVRQEAETFLSVVQGHLVEFRPTEETPLPNAGRVRFYVRAFQG